MALTDAAAFLPPPTAAVPESSTPEIATQRRIWLAAVDYVTRMVPTLPKFFADRVTWRFDNSPLPDKSKAEPFHPLRYVGGSTVTVLYRDRREVVAPGGASTRQENDPSFSTNGEFGASLDMIFGDVSSELPSWSGWEHGSNGNYAVFRYAVGRGASHYAVYSRRTGMFASAATAKEMPGYHGEIVVDPANGAVMRLTVIPDINPMSSISRADILIEYGPVEIGGRTYICPISSVAIAQVRTDGMPAGLAPWGDNAAHSITRINHVDFQRYHLFRAESRIVTGDTVETKKP